MLAQVLGCISCSSRSHEPNQSASVGRHCNRLGSRTEHAHWGWSLWKERRRRNGWREREKESHGTEMLQLWEQRLLHLKTCYWRHRWSVRGCFQRLLGRTATAREQLCDKVKRVKRCLLWWLMINHYVTLINCWTANSACRLHQDIYSMADFCHLQGFRQREDVRLLFPFSLHLLHCL